MNRTLALVSTVAAVTAAPAAHADDYILENDHTYAYFKVRHMDRGDLTGVFKDVKGKVVIQGDAVRSVDVTIAVDSVDTFSGPRDAHLKSPDYFNVKRYPKMTFKSTQVTAKGKGRYAIEGKLTIHGRTRTVVAQGVRGTTGKDPFGGYRTGGNVTFTINRRDFGITHMPNALVGDTIEVDLYWEALEKSTVETYFAGLKKALGG